MARRTDSQDGAPRARRGRLRGFRRRAGDATGTPALAPGDGEQPPAPAPDASSGDAPADWLPTTDTPSSSPASWAVPGGAGRSDVGGAAPDRWVPDGHQLAASPGEGAPDRWLPTGSAAGTPVDADGGAPARWVPTEPQDAMPVDADVGEPERWMPAGDAPAPDAGAGAAARDARPEDEATTGSAGPVPAEAPGHDGAWDDTPAGTTAASAGEDAPSPFLPRAPGDVPPPDDHDPRPAWARRTPAQWVPDEAPAPEAIPSPATAGARWTPGGAAAEDAAAHATEDGDAHGAADAPPAAGRPAPRGAAAVPPPPVAAGADEDVNAWVVPGLWDDRA